MADTQPQPTITQPIVEESKGLDAPIPLSFPAILRHGQNPQIGVTLGITATHKTLERVRKGRTRDTKEGKRWIRRDNNARFIANPHIALPTSGDMAVHPPAIRSTFPVPLPPGIPRTAPIPNASIPNTDKNSAISGQFSMSLRGMRKELRKAGPRAENLVKLVEAELQDWLGSDVVLKPTDDASSGEPRRIGSDYGTILEIRRNHAQLVWSLEEDAFARWVVHCVARYHGVVSFSKDTSGTRLTYLLRPSSITVNQAPSFLNTPPVTDLDSASDFIVSDKDVHTEASDSELGPLTEEEDYIMVDNNDVMSSPPRRNNLPESVEVTPRRPAPITQTENDADRDDSGDSVVDLTESLTLEDNPNHTTPRAAPYVRRNITRGIRSQLRSGSSPSRSPSRRYMRTSGFVTMRSHALQNRAIGRPPVPLPAERAHANFWQYVYQ
ncbi:hypothetical protein FRC03_012876 [Tulasnella sp. 419]|nr:hypothetical protein FRC03_012876 [Tulasnella sp. 419]